MIEFVRRKPRGGNVLKIVGAKIGHLEVMEFAGYAKTSSVFLCKCDCGNLCYRRGAHLNQARWKLIAGEKLSYGYKLHTHCGCLSNFNTGLDSKGTAFHK